jgi:hypothetical protein
MAWKLLDLTGAAKRLVAKDPKVGRNKPQPRSTFFPQSSDASLRSETPSASKRLPKGVQGKPLGKGKRGKG